MLAGYLALMTASLFTGAAFYISFAEQPARLGLDDRALLAEWKPAYKRGFAMQAPLAIVGFVLGIVAWRLTGGVMFLIGGAFLFANLPWTIFGVMPTNRLLMATEPGAENGQSRALIVKWNRLHTVRTVLGCLAILAFLIAL
jgi:Anthrone oxygenase